MIVDWVQVCCITWCRQTRHPSRSFNIYFIFIAQPSNNNHSKDTAIHKKYVIEVQNHQQAMKYADPMVDLEETVRRGINNPYNDPKFFMNRVNEDFFGQPPQQRAESLYAGASPRQAIDNSLHSEAHIFDLTPQRIIAENAAAKSNLALQNQNNRRLQPLFRLAIPRQENADKSASIPSIPSPMDDSIAALLAKVSRAQNNRDTLLKKALLGSKKDVQETINPLTGLPENLEEKSYGAVTSIESVSDRQPQRRQQPAVTVVDLSRAATRRLHRIGERRGHNLSNRQFSAAEIKQNVKTDMSNLMAGTVGSNFDSIKSFLEADDILRKKLNDEINNKILQ